jgi:hypothetical protein
VTTALDEYETREVEILIARQYGASCHVPGRPEVTNGLFLSPKRTERERRWARGRGIPPKTAPQPAHGVDGKTGVSRQAAPPPYRSPETGNSLFPLYITLRPFRLMSAYVSNLSVPLLLAVPSLQRQDYRKRPQPVRNLVVGSRVAREHGSLKAMRTSGPDAL